MKEQKVAIYPAQLLYAKLKDSMRFFILLLFVADFLHINSCLDKDIGKRGCLCSCRLNIVYFALLLSFLTRVCRRRTWFQQTLQLDKSMVIDSSTQNRILGPETVLLPDPHCLSASFLSLNWWYRTRALCAQEGRSGVKKTTVALEEPHT